MAIKHRRGLKINLDKTKLVPGEFAFQLDRKRVTATFENGETRDMATVEEFDTIIDNVNAVIQNADTVTEDASEAISNANKAATNANGARNEAEKATTATNEATKKANAVIDATNIAKVAAIEATKKANDAISEATTAAANANTAANGAETSAASANESKSDADKATIRANTAAEACEGIVAGTGFISVTEKGKANGVATLNASGKVPSDQLDISMSPAYTEASTVTTLSSGENLGIALGKIKKWYTDKISKLKALAFKDKVALTDLETTVQTLVNNAIQKSLIANNLTTTNAGMVLSAPMGKNLQDQVSMLNQKLAINTEYTTHTQFDFNSHTRSENSTVNLQVPLTTANFKNAPELAAGFLVVIAYGNVLVQVYDSYAGKLYYRLFWYSWFQEWRCLQTTT